MSERNEQLLEQILQSQLRQEAHLEKIATVVSEFDRRMRAQQEIMQQTRNMRPPKF